MKLDCRLPARRSIHPAPVSPGHICLALATDDDREAIFRLRHEVFARELGQHSPNPAGRLRDALDDCNHYLVAKVGGEVAGFISLTPPTAPMTSDPVGLTQ